MAIDVLSGPDSIPIIVGDADEMTDLQAVGSDAGAFHLVMVGPQGPHQVPLSPPASENFSTAKHLLLVSVTPADQVTTARRVRIDNLADGHDLSTDQSIALAKALSLGSGSPRQFQTAALAEFSSNYPEIAAA